MQDLDQINCCERCMRESENVFYEILFAMAYMRDECFAGESSARLDNI